jgi:hypothetical protein
MGNTSLVCMQNVSVALPFVRRLRPWLTCPLHLQHIITEDMKIRLPNGTIVAAGTRGGKQDVVRWIGILFDRKPSFTYHVCTKMTAASRAFNALCSLVRYETGLSPSATCQLY